MIMLNRGSVSVNSAKKRDRILLALKTEGRRGYWEEFYGYTEHWYVIWYKVREV